MSIRTEKVAEEIKHRITEVLSKDINGLNLGLVTVTKVLISSDLKNAKVFVSFLGNKTPVEKCLDKINFRKKQIRMHLGAKIHLKVTPELQFYYDDTMEYASHIEELIKKIHNNDKPETEK